MDPVITFRVTAIFGGSRARRRKLITLWRLFGLPAAVPYAIAETTQRFWRAFVRQVIEVNVTTANKCAPGKGGIPSLLAVERARPALPEHNRSFLHILVLIRQDPRPSQFSVH